MCPLFIFTRRSVRLLMPPAFTGSILAALVTVLAVALPAAAQTDVPSPGAGATQVPLMTRPAPPTETVPTSPEPTRAPTPAAEEAPPPPREDVALNVPARI